MPHRSISTINRDRKLIAMPTATTVSQIAELMRLHHINTVLVAEGPANACGASAPNRTSRSVGWPWERIPSACGSMRS